MYHSITPDEYRKHLLLPKDYKVDGILCFGSWYEDQMSKMLNAYLQNGAEATVSTLKYPFLRYVKEVKINGKTIWYVMGYGGAWLSEYLHWGCLFGSQKNILIGVCGGLKTGMRAHDWVVPTFSFGNESSARMYNRKSSKHYSEAKLSKAVMARLSNTQGNVWRGPVITCQGMIAETWEDVTEWSEQGYYGVEMESSTVFAVSKHFDVPSAAILFVADNLTEEKAVVSEEYINNKYQRDDRHNEQFRVALEELIA